MPDETTATPEPVVEPAPAATTTEPAKPEEPKPEPDWQAAYKGLQRTVEKLHKSQEAVRDQNVTLVETVKILKEGQSAILKNSLGEDEARAFDDRQKQAEQQAQAVRAAQAAEKLVKVQTDLYLELLEDVGVDPKTVDWASDATSPDEWLERVKPNIKSAVKKSIETNLRKAQEGIEAKTKKEIAAEAEALAQQQIKEAGVDKIDTGKGNSTSSMAERIARLDPSSPEFKKFYDDVMAGRANF